MTVALGSYQPGQIHTIDVGSMSNLTGDDGLHSHADGRSIYVRGSLRYLMSRHEHHAAPAETEQAAPVGWAHIIVVRHYSKLLARLQICANLPAAVAVMVAVAVVVVEMGCAEMTGPRVARGRHLGGVPQYKGQQVVHPFCDVSVFSAWLKVWTVGLICSAHPFRRVEREGGSGCATGQRCVERTVLRQCELTKAE
jgi:hypothetical protein